jgi:predicted patatin/cPLA2 family phospholipase
VLDGVNPAAVIDAIQARAAGRRANPGATDGRRLGLVVEGGAMRGVCSAGGLAALAHLGLSDLFDEIYATSAGAMNASYFLSGQANLGIRVYYEDMIQGRVINPWRVWKILDLDQVFDRILTGHKALDARAVAGSRTRLYVSMLDARTGELLLVDTRTARSPLMTVLKASTAIPVAYNRSIEVDGRLCIDAGVANPFPLQEALASGCTDLLVLLTRPRGFRREKPGRASDWIFRMYARGKAELRRAYARQPERDTELRALALGQAPTPPGVNIATLCVGDEHVVQRLTVDPIRLHAAAVGCGRRMLAVMGADGAAWSLPRPGSPPVANRPGELS